jgi:hypothetical protein
MTAHARVLAGALALALACCGSGGGGGGGGDGGGGGPDPESLSALAISHGSLSPAFDADVTDYTVGPAPVPASVTITPTTANAGATVLVDGSTTTSGSPSLPIALDMGETEVDVVVTAPDGIAQRTYTITFDRTSADLISLVASTGPLDPSFVAGVTNYVVEPTGPSSTLTAVTADPTATLVIDGTVVDSGEESEPFAFPTLMTTVEVEIFPRGGFSKTYTVIFDRTPQALFFDDFSEPTLGSAWSGTGTLDASSGAPPPCLALSSNQSVEYVGTSFESDSNVTFTFEIQRDQQVTRAKVFLFDVNDAQRWISVELSGTTMGIEWVDDGGALPVTSGFFPIPANDFLFHTVEVKCFDDGTIQFRHDGTLKGSFLDYPATEMRFRLAHPNGSGGPSNFARFDEVTVTSP